MSDEAQSAQTFSRRAILLGMGGTGAFAALAARLYYLQIVKAESFTTLSDKNRFNFNIVVPSRGRILDRQGNFLAINKQDYRVIIVPEQVEDIEKTLNIISDIVPVSNGMKRRIHKEINDNARFVPILVADHVDWEGFSALNMRTPDLPGVIPEVGEGRLYLYDGAFSHILGYVGRANSEDIKVDNDPLLRQPTFRIGKTGVERSAEKKLRGRAGKLKVEVNAMGRIVREWPVQKDHAVSGEDVWLTIDADLQVYGSELFEEDSGGLAVIDVMTGELRSLLSMPTFDNNMFVSGITQANLDEMNLDEKRPQFNKVIGGGYPPASTFKMVVMLAGLKHGFIRPSERILCTGKLHVGNRDFHCHSRKGHGALNLRNALKHSCDIYFYEIAQRMNMDLVRETAYELGLGQTFNLGISGQTSGVVPGPDWKKKRLGQRWRTGDSLNAFIGQGFVLSTPLQLAVMTARLANGQKAVTPYLVIDETVPDFVPLNIDSEHLKLVQQAMWAVCEEPGGTAYFPTGIGLPGVMMAGKTGTGQVRGISAKERARGVLRNQALPWKLRDHSIFVGYAPYETPRFAAAALVEHGGSGAGRAATIVRNILKRALERDGIGQDKPYEKNNQYQTEGHSPSAQIDMSRQR